MLVGYWHVQQLHEVKLLAFNVVFLYVLMYVLIINGICFKYALMMNILFFLCLR